MTRYCAGIDLGTTNTVLSVWLHGSSAPEIVPIHQPVEDAHPQSVRALPMLDSVVTLFGGKVFVGAYARFIAHVPDACSFVSIKRFMGRQWFRTHEGVGWTPERVSACILKVVHDELRARFNAPPECLVITIPASFGTEARRATLNAAALAGFESSILSLFDEPTAALLAQLRGKPLPDEYLDGRRHAVVDIGGGTLDVSLVRVQREGQRTIFDVIGQSRYNELAGDDFDLNIAGLLLHRFEQERGSLRSVFGKDRERELMCWSLLKSARDVKHRLSLVLDGQPPSRWPSLRESVTVSEIAELDVWRTEVSGSDLVEALKEYFPIGERGARNTTFGFFAPIQECLDTASIHEGRPIEPMEVDMVWMTGGSALLPPVKVALQHLFYRPPQLINEPMFAVARGAAWKAGLNKGYGDGQFEVRERTFDGVFLKTTRGEYVSLVPVRQEVPMLPTMHRNLVHLPHPDKRLALDLYIGTQPEPGETTPNLDELRVSVLRTLGALQLDPGPEARETLFELTRTGPAAIAGEIRACWTRMFRAVSLDAETPPERNGS